MARSNRVTLPKTPTLFRAEPPLRLPFWSARWFRAVFFLAVLVGALALGVVGAKTNPVYAVVAGALPLALVALQWLLLREAWVPPLLLAVALYLPFSLPTGTGSRLVISLLLTILFAGILIVRMASVEHRLRLAPNLANLPLIGFISVVIVSVAWSILFRDPAVYASQSFVVVQLASAAVMVMLPGAYLMMGNHIRSRKELVFITALILIAGVVGLIKQVYQVNLPVNTGGMFNLWVIATAVGLALFNQKLATGWRLALIGLAGAWVYYAFVLEIHWLAGWLPGVLAVALIVYSRSRKLFVVLAVIALIILLVRSDYYINQFFVNEAGESGYTRLDAWAQNWRITKDHLLFGTGPAGYAVYYMSYFPDQAMATHNNYLDIVAQTGLVGMALVAWFFIAQLVMAVRLVRRLRGRRDFYEAMANVSLAGTLACIVIMAFGDWLFPFAYTQTIAGYDYALYNWIFMGFTLAIDRLTRGDAPEASHA
jgi:hypothetical protein